MGLRRWAITTTVGLYVVILIGFLDTFTGSALGCGAMWPLCNGQFVPSPSLQSWVEYSHRAITGIVGLMVAWIAIWAWRRFQRPLEVPILAAVGLGFVIVQAIMGAAAVLWPESPLVMALHFGFALIAFGGFALLTVVLYQLAPSSPGSSLVSGWDLRGTPLPTLVKQIIWTILIYTFALAYLGTYVAHVGAGSACAGWPLCNGQWFPPLTGSVTVVFFHRLAAVGLLVLTLWLFSQARRLKASRPDIHRAAHAALALVVLQIFSGAYLILSHLAMTAEIIHVALVTVLFADLSYLGLQTLAPSGPRSLGHLSRPAESGNSKG